MSLVLVVLLVALGIGVLAGGSVSRLAELSLRRPRLVLGALGVQVVGTLVGGPVYPVALAVSAALVAAFLVHHRGLRGVGLVALGLCGNALVVGLNGAMPVSESASLRAGVPAPGLFVEDPRHEPSGPATRLPWLGDVVAVPLPLRPEVVSPGDVLIAAGLAQLVVVGMQPPRRLHRALPRRAGPTATSTVRGCATLSAHRLEERSWPSEAASAARARRATPTTASVPTPEPARRKR